MNTFRSAKPLIPAASLRPAAPCCLALLLLMSCVEAFEPPPSGQTADMLVVDGFINGSEGTATVKLSKARALTDPNPSPAELNATVSIQSSTGRIFPLAEQDSGLYTSSNIVQEQHALYTLLIETSNGSDYASDPIKILETPPIDSISYYLSANNAGLKVMVNTRAVESSGGYFAWSYVETYQYRVPFVSRFAFFKPVVIERSINEPIDVCWKTELASRIVIGNAAGNEGSVLPQFPVTEIPLGSQKISERYSILLTQRAISAQEYQYLNELRSATESLGSLYDPSPGTVAGNIHQLNDRSATVLGYFSAATLVTQRSFISFRDLPDVLRVKQVYKGCQLDTTCLLNAPPLPMENCVRMELLDRSIIIVSAVGDFANPEAYSYVPGVCGDCRLQGGTLVKPDFW